MRKLRERMRKTLHAAVTLEAALVLPIFLYVFVNLLTLFEALYVQTGIEAALHQAGRELGQIAFDVSFGEDVLRSAGTDTVTDGTAGAVFTATYGGARAKAYLAEAKTNLRCVRGGESGISFLRSALSGGDGVIDLIASYEIQPLLRLMSFTAFPAEARYYGHAWTGYRIPGTSEEAEEKEETVYVTEKGSVYHRTAGCTYLKPSVRSVDASSVGSLRSANGAIYYRCESCGAGAAAAYYVTDYGNRYHRDASCKKIHHHVLSIPLSEAQAQGRPPCSKCGF